MAEPQGLLDAALEKEIGPDNLPATPHGKHEASEVVDPANTQVAMGGSNDTTRMQADGSPPSSSATKTKLKPAGVMLQSSGNEGSKIKSVKAAAGKSGSSPPTPLVKKVCNLCVSDPLVYMCFIDNQFRNVRDWYGEACAEGIDYHHKSRNS